MTSSFDLSLVMTAHRHVHLAEAIGSVRAQRTGCRFEVVVVVDALGEPGLEGYASELCADLPNARVVAYSGGTAGRVRNRGFSLAASDWVAYLDGDDALRVDAIEVMWQAHLRCPRAGILCSGMQRVTQAGEAIPLPESLTYAPPAWLYYEDPDVRGVPTYMNQFMVIRRDIWSRYPFYEHTNGEDIDFILHALLAGEFLKVPEPLYCYRDTPDSFSKQSFRDSDICTQRYRSGYYAQLFESTDSEYLWQNFGPTLLQRGGGR